MKLSKTLISSTLLCFTLSLQATPIRLSGFEYLSKKDIVIKPTDSERVVVFLSATCPCSNSHILHLKNLVTAYPKVQFIGVHSNKNESKNRGIEYFQGKSLNFPVLRDPLAKLADQFGALKTPHVFVVSKSDQIIFSGPVTDSRTFETSNRKYLKEFLTSLNSQGSFKPIQKRPLGCFIVR